ncbi:MAG: hypothetical protein JXM73_02420 [Anaerolineae bacterium]|nr:hypothetical protein [Anaerolineae bacterium]
MEEIENAALPQGMEATPTKGRSIGKTIAIVLIVIVVAAAIGAAIWGLATHAPFAAVLRDIAIIVLALVTGVIGIFLAILIFQVQSLIALLRHEVKPILDSANQTVSTVRGTSTFVSDTVVSPMIQALSFASGVRQTAKVLFRRPGRRLRSQTRRSENDQG